MTRDEWEPTPANAPGDFYVAKDMCIACRAPEAEAPDLMGFDDSNESCFFRRQPTTADELEHAVRAVWVSCCGAVRYRGSSPEIQSKLIELGELESVDVPLQRLIKGAG
jgi:ferredoxin